METFMVRVWKPGGDERSEGLRGTAVHLSSGQSLTFSEAETLVRFLEEPAAAADNSSTADTAGGDSS
jgi:hypothetical protein